MRVSLAVRDENADRHFVACSTKTNASSETSNSGAHDDNLHGFGRLRAAVAVLQGNDNKSRLSTTLVPKDALVEL